MNKSKDIIEVTTEWYKEQVEDLIGESIPEDKWNEMKFHIKDSLEEHYFDYGRKVIRSVVQDFNEGLFDE